MPLSLEIITPSETVFSEEVDHVVVPTRRGKIDILPKHIPIIDKLVAGDIKIERNGNIEFLAVGSGFVEVYAEKVSLLTDQAINVSEVDEEAINEAVIALRKHFRKRRLVMLIKRRLINWKQRLGMHLLKSCQVKDKVAT